jgi:hypothetical protein
MWQNERKDVTIVFLPPKEDVEPAAFKQCAMDNDVEESDFNNDYLRKEDSP